ncbi:MAG TPA: class I adenylate-forming enzyme family protein [Thermoanaerobaculia bacterium]|jgi:acyl-CoA synthetase (AMP-forming)/AMP-acid ligase II
MHLAELLAVRAANHPDKIAFAMRGATVTYRELWNDAGLLARGLAARGVRPRDRVALILPAGLEFVRLFWAIQRLGATSVAFNPFVPEETATKRAERVKPKLIVRGGQAITPVPSVDEDEDEGQAGLPDLHSEDLAFLQPTSGTTGESRAVMIAHRNLFAVLAAAAEALQIAANDVLVAWVPPWHDLGLVRFIIGTVYAGATCHIVEPAVRTIPEWLETVSKVRGTISGAPDFAIRLAARLVDPATVDLSSLRYITNGGEAVRLSTIEAFERRFNVPGIVLPGYGLAEATLGVTAMRPGERVRTDDRGNVSCGRTMPGVEVRIGEDGELLVRGDGVFAGYFEAEEATRASIVDGWLHTGDTAHVDADGHVYILGRKRAMLKRGGAVLAPRELEEAAQEVRGVKIACAVGIASDSTEQLVVAIESDLDPAPLALEVSRSIHRALGFAPDRVIVLAPRSIPRTYNGKLRHDALRQALASGDVAIVYDSRAT